MAPKANIPIIDIASPDVDRANVARQLVDAAAEHGFIYIRSTGKYVALGDIDTAFSLVLLFFELPVNSFSIAKPVDSPRSSSSLP